MDVSRSLFHLLLCSFCDEWGKKLHRMRKYHKQNAFNIMLLYRIELMDLELYVCWTTITTVLISFFSIRFHMHWPFFFCILFGAQNTCAHLIENDKNIFRVNDAIVYFIFTSDALSRKYNVVCLLSVYNQGILAPLGMQCMCLYIHKPSNILHSFSKCSILFVFMKINL